MKPILFAKCPFCAKQIEAGKVYHVKVVCDAEWAKSTISGNVDESMLVDEDLIEITEDSFFLLASSDINWVTKGETVEEAYRGSLEKLDQGQVHFKEVPFSDYPLFLGWKYISARFSKMLEQGGIECPVKDAKAIES
jgi:hypothetical protein